MIENNQIINNIEQFLNIYEKTSHIADDIKKKIGVSIPLTTNIGEKEELIYQYQVFRNMKNFIASNINDVMDKEGYKGFDPTSMMLSEEIQSEDVVFTKWQQMAFDECGYKKIENMSDEAIVAGTIDPKLFHNHGNWSTIAFGKDSHGNWIKAECGMGDNKSKITKSTVIDDRVEQLVLENILRDTKENYKPLNMEQEKRTDPTMSEFALKIEERNIKRKDKKLSNIVEDISGVIEDDYCSASEQEAINQEKHETQSA